MAVVWTSAQTGHICARMFAACGNFAGFGAKTGALTERYLGPQTALRELREEVPQIPSVLVALPR